MNTLEDFLRDDAARYPDKIAVICGEEVVTYSELNERVEAQSALFRNNDTAENGYLILRASQNIQFLVDYFAAHRCGCVAVPLEKDTPQCRVDEISFQLKHTPIPEGSADILYTTGTTGKSKGVIISHRTIVANAENLIDSQGFSHDLHFLICGPLNHIGSLSKVYPVILTGGTLHIIEGMKDINSFFEALDYPCDKFATFLVPASIRMLLQLNADRLGQYATKLDFIETGAAPMAQSDMERLCNLLPKTRLYNTYASTETGIIATYNFNNGHCKAGCLGKAMKHAEFYITEEGKVACKGATLMSGYIGDAELTASVMHDDTIFTSDLGKIDEEGMLSLIGREDDVINVGGFKVAPSEIEEIVLQLPSVADCICIAAQHPVIGTVLKLLVVVKEGESFEKKTIARFIHSKVESYKVPFYYESVDKIARTYNGKINRKFYR